MRVDPDVQGSGGTEAFAQRTDRLSCGQNVGLVEAAVEGAAAVTRSAETDALGSNLGIWGLREVRSHEARHVDENGIGSGLTGEGRKRHGRGLRGVRFDMAVRWAEIADPLLPENAITFTPASP